jgi:hypothetical protein
VVGHASKPKAPTGLGTSGRSLWRAIAGVYELRPDELRILTDACREADLVDRLEAALADAELIVKGSMGQLVASPLVSEVRQHRTVLAGLLRSLKLPDAPDTDRTSTYVSEQARAAARARWGTRKGT